MSLKDYIQSQRWRFCYPW